MKIWDCFPFYNELMLLEIRLNELSPLVDKFVLVEATHTYSGKPKPLYYDEVKDNEIFGPFKDKITHLVFREKPMSKSALAEMKKANEEQQESVNKQELFSDLIFVPAVDEIVIRRIYETRQKNIIEQGLAGAAPDDIIIMSDVDEIPRPGIFPLIKAVTVPCKLDMKMFYYYFNCKINRRWNWAAFCRFRDYKTAQILRLGREYHKNILLNAGWHFSDLMSPEKIALKIGSICHAEFDTDYFKNIDRIKKHIEANEDIYERPGVSFTIEPLDAPECVMNNTGKYGDFIKNGQN